MYTFILGINIHVCQPFVNLREMFADYVQLTKHPFLGWHSYSDRLGRRRVKYTGAISWLVEESYCCHGSSGSHFPVYLLGFSIGGHCLQVLSPNPRTVRNDVCGGSDPAGVGYVGVKWQRTSNTGSASRQAICRDDLGLHVVGLLLQIIPPRGRRFPCWRRCVY